MNHLSTTTTAIATSTATALAGVLRRAAAAGSLRLALQAHARAFPLGLHASPLLTSALISAYSHLNLPSLSSLVFSSFPSAPSLLLSNSLLAALSRANSYHESLSLFSRLRALHSPDPFTLSIASKAAAELSDSDSGKMIHTMIIKLGFESIDIVLSNSLMCMYFKCGDPGAARKLFNEMPVRSIASWNCIISELGKSGQVWDFVGRMQMEGLKPDGFTISSVLPLCGADTRRGREIHCFVVRHDLGLGSDFHVGSCLVNMYSRSGRLDLGRRVFDRMASKNVVAWTAMITGYVEGGEFEDALSLFRKMQLVDGIVPNNISLVSILPAVGSLASLVEGKQVHGFAIRRELNCEASLNNALIDMYSKCGSLDSARQVFDDRTWCKDTISWSSMISCYGIHGRGEEAVALFDKMCTLGVKLDHTTIVGVLSACGRSGLVSEGVKIYNSLVNNLQVCPTVEIYSCMVDMLGRAGQLSQALALINSMPLTPGPSVWGALFSASIIHKNREVQDLAYKFLLQQEPENPSNYVFLSNLHASSGRWDIVAEMRKNMKERGLTKIPGCSSISVNNKVQSFYVADKSHQCSDMIYAVLDNLLFSMKGAEFVLNNENLT